MQDLFKKYKWQIIAGGAALAVLLIVIIVFAAQRSRKNRTYENFDVVGKTREFAETSEVNYLPSAKGVFRYTRDGAEVVNEKGKTIWNVSYNMNKPIGDSCGNAAAVGDIGAKSLYIFDGSGNANPITTAYPIEKVQVASQGVTAVWMNNGIEDYITLYKNDGTKITDMNTLVATSGFPVDITLSNDGTKLVTTFVSFEKEHIQSQLNFYNFGDVGGNYVDGLVGIESFKDEMVADVEFIDNNTLVVFGEKGFRIYDMEEIQSLKQEVKIAEPMKSVTCSDQYIGVVLESNAKGGNYIVRIYDRSGKVVDERSMTDGFSNFLIDGSDVILFNELEVYIYRIGGKDKIRIALKKSLKYVYALDDVNEFVFVGDTYLERVRLVGERRGRK